MILLPTSTNQTAEVLAKIAKRFRLSESILQRDFSGKSGETLTIYAKDTSYTLLGLGDAPSVHDLRSATRLFAFQHRTKLETLTLDLKSFPHPFRKNIYTAVQAAREGFELGLYELARHKTIGNQAILLKAFSILVASNQIEKAQIAETQGKIIAEAQKYAMQLIDAPANVLTPKEFAKSIKQSAKKYGYKAKTYDLDDIKKLGMGGLVAVNQGSKHPATFTILEYKPENAVRKIGLVGKGVTFDSGGISIKPADNMLWMKCDMGGAAIVAATIEAAARLQLPVHLIGAIPATENKLGDNAFLPSDVLQMHNGMTVEVEDTDAEGRLILADALSYLATQYQPDVLLDFATLTGACVTALGYSAAGLFTQNETLANALYQSGQTSQDKVWRLPLWDEYTKHIQSDVADLKNLGGRAGGAITAAKFLEAFTHQHSSWAHLDVAGVVFGDDAFGKMRHATGWGIRFMVAFLAKQS